MGDARLELTLEFLTPALPDDLAVLARPLTYVSWEARSRDGRPHAVQVYFDVGPEVSVNVSAQAVRPERFPLPGLQVLRVGSVDQLVLARQGDDIRIDWGHAYLAATDSPALQTRIASGESARDRFARDGRLPEQDNSAAPAPASTAPVLAARFDLGSVHAAPARQWLMLAYDDITSIRYFDADLAAYWKKDGTDLPRLLTLAASGHDRLRARCLDFDRRLRGELERHGGPAYALIGALAYRQTLAGCKLVADRRGQPLLFPKENHSNGCIATVDVIYPMAPFTLLFSPALSRALLVPVFDYALSPRWKFDFAPHDLGRYPHATGQAYGGGERTLDRQMMVEESANLILLAAALARQEGNPSFVAPYWKILGTWADYLRRKGFDPENQLCTDDFAGHLAHNVNLSAKAIVALGAFAQLAGLRGDSSLATEYRALAISLARRWVEEAADGDHYRLAFDRPGTWSQKYNLVWDRLLGLRLFPLEVLRREVDYYRRIQGPFGLPLDNRSTYTKLDWIFWTAALTGVREDFDALTAPVLAFLNQTPDRSPMTDWYFTDTAKKRGFTARPVVGGVFIAVLGDPAAWRRWSQAGESSRTAWAPLPMLPSRTLAATGEEAPATWRSAASVPPGNWTARHFDDRAWTSVAAPLGLDKATSAGVNVRTATKGKHLWLRREFLLTSTDVRDLRVRLATNGDTQIWLNGVVAARLASGTRGYQQIPVSAAAQRALLPGTNVVAVQCTHPGENPPRGELLDVGLVDLQPQ
jgi:hypothetical protein